MTLIIAMDMGSLGLIASDKAEVMIDATGGISPIHQDADKIIQTPLGVITGAGRVELLDQVKEFVKAGGVQNTDQILAAILQARMQFRSRYGNHPEVESAISNTSWVFNYTAILDDERTVHRIAMSHSSLGEKNFRILEPGRAACIAPSSFSAGEAESLTGQVQAKMRVPSPSLDIASALLNNVEVAVQAMAEVSGLASSVSEICDIAIVGKGLNEVFDNVTPANWESRFNFLKQ